MVCLFEPLFPHGCSLKEFTSITSLRVSNNQVFRVVSHNSELNQMSNAKLTLVLFHSTTQKSIFQLFMLNPSALQFWHYHARKVRINETIII